MASHPLVGCLLTSSLAALAGQGEVQVTAVTSWVCLAVELLTGTHGAPCCLDPRGWDAVLHGAAWGC